MMAVRTSGEYEQWVNFFLKAVAECAGDAIIAIKRLDTLHRGNETKIRALGRASMTALRLLSYIERSPIISIGTTARALDVSCNTASAAVKRLQGIGILSPVFNVARNRLFSYTAYLDVLRDGTRQGEPIIPRLRHGQRLRVTLHLVETTLESTRREHGPRASRQQRDARGLLNGETGTPAALPT